MTLRQNIHVPSSALVDHVHTHATSQNGGKFHFWSSTSAGGDAFLSVIDCNDNADMLVASSILLTSGFIPTGKTFRENIRCLENCVYMQENKPHILIYVFCMCNKRCEKFHPSIHPPARCFTLWSLRGRGGRRLSPEAFGQESGGGVEESPAHASLPEQVHPPTVRSQYSATAGKLGNNARPYHVHHW